MRSHLLQDPAEEVAAVRLRGLDKSFGRRRALAGLDLAVEEGAVYVLVGPNGAGKTTTLRLLLDLVAADRGSAQIFGQPVAGNAALRGGIGYLPEGQEFGYGRLKVARLLEHHAAYFPSWDPAYARRLSRALEIDGSARFKDLSKGQSRRVQLLMALAHRPRLLLLDEPTDGLDPLARSDALALLADHLASTATTVLLSTHVIHEVEGLGDWLGVMKKGRLVAQLERGEMAARLLRLRGTVENGWAPSTRLDPLLVHGRQRGREVDWVVWSPEDEIRSRLAGSGITPTDVSALNLEEAATALLRMEDS